MTDGRFTCAYGDLPGRLDDICRYLDTLGAGADAVPALECINSTAGVLTLLALLRRGSHFLLNPGSGNVEPTDSNLKPVARFCTHRIVVLRAPPEAPPDWLETPGNFLSVSRHADYLGPPGACDPGIGNLYIRTSGSLGTTKIVVHGQTRLFHNADSCLDRLGLEAEDRVTLPVPIFHMYGLGAGFLPALLAGASIHVEEHGNILRYLDNERRFQPNVAFLNPLLCGMLLRWGRFGSSYRRVVTSTQAMREEMFRDFDDNFGNLISLYGSTEMGAITASLSQQSQDKRAAGLGPPLRGVTLRLEDDNKDGAELLCLHPYGYRGYLDEAGHWLHRCAEGEWYRSGDWARQRNDGILVILGRANSSVNRGGYLVFLGDIENELEKLPEISQAAVIASDEEDHRGRRLTAFCIPKQGVTTTADALRAACFRHLPKHSIPDHIHLLSSLPLLPSGKLDRKTLLLHSKELI